MVKTDGYITMEDGVRLYFEKVGNGPTAVVVLNGFIYLDAASNIKRVEYPS